MNKKSVFFIILISFVLSFFTNLFGWVNRERRIIDDLQFTSIVQKVYYSEDQNRERILSGEKRSFSFHSIENNLGIIAFLFDNFEVKTSDNIYLKLAEVNSGDIVYKEKYSTEKITGDYFYTFGFPAIKNSKNKEYTLEIESLKGINNNSIAINKKHNFYLLKYSYPKSYLVNNKKEILPFIFKKVASYFGYVSFNYVKLSINTAILFTIKFAIFAILFYKFLYKSLIGYLTKIYKRKKEFKKYLNKYFSSNVFKNELSIVIFPIVLFLNTAFLSPLGKNFDRSLLLLILLSIIDLIYLKFLFNRVSLLNKIFVKKYWQILIPVSLFSLIRFSFLDAVPKWDSAVYYHGLLKSIKAFDFNFGSFMAFNWHKHPSMGYGLYSSIFQFLSPDSILMLNIGNLILGIFAIIAFYFLISHFFVKNSNLEKILATSLFAVNPLFLSVSGSFVPDYGVLVFFVMGLASFLYEKHLLTSFFFLLAIFSKETGGYSYTLFALFYLLLVLFKSISKIKIKKIVNFFFYLIPGIIYFFYLLYTKGSHWTAGKPITIIAKDCFFCFGFRPLHFIQNIWVMLVLNFSWIFTLFIVLFLVKLFLKIINKKKIINSLKNKEIISIFLTFLGFISFFMVFIIYIIPSYMLISVFFLTLLGYFAINYVLSNKFYKLVVLTAIILLLSIQNFISIDPISAKAFGTFKFGNYNIPQIGTEYAADGLIYNSQFVYIDRLINKLHKHISITKNTNIIFSANYWDSFYLGGGGYDLYINNDNLELTFSKDGSFRPGIYSLKGSKNHPETGYYILFPWLENEKDSIKVLKTVYKIEKEEKIEIDGYWLGLYKVIKNK